MNESEINQSTSNEQPDIVVKEGERADTTESEVKQLYDDLGIKAPTPSGKTKGRPKTSGVRAKNGKSKDTGSADNGEEKDADDKSKSKNAPASNENGDSGDDADEKGAKKRSDSRQVSDESEEADNGVRESESKGEEDSERRGEGDSETGDDDAEGKDDQEKGKRSKSKPEVEKRFQKLTSDVRERDALIAELQEKIREADRTQYEQRSQHEDPEYTLDDFRRVRDNQGNVLDLDDDQAELAYRRWRDGYEQRGSEREAAYQHQLQEAQRQEETAQRLMQSSVEAYDMLNSMVDDFPELVESSGAYDPELTSTAMPLIENSIIYQPGTEPGNAEGLAPVIVGTRINPREIVEALKQVRDARRSLPLNGLNDSVETRSNVSVPHSRSSDPTVNAANDLYRQLGINKRM